METTLITTSNKGGIAMFSEKGSNSMRDTEHVTLQTREKEIPCVHMTGDHIDRIYKHGSLVDVRVGHNIVVEPFLRLVMCLLKEEAGFKGVQYWAIGSGLPLWDTTLPNPVVTDTRLENEICRVPISLSDVQFLDPSFNVSTTPTNILQIRRLFDENTGNGVWREFGIFGGNATAALNSGLMINHRNHAVLTKTTDMAVERILRFTLSLV